MVRKRLVSREEPRLHVELGLTPLCLAILSVYDKTGLLDLAKGLVKQNIRLLASGGTAKLIREGGFPVEYDYTHPICRKPF